MPSPPCGSGWVWGGGNAPRDRPQSKARGPRCLVKATPPTPSIISPLPGRTRESDHGGRGAYRLKHMGVPTQQHPGCRGRSGVPYPAAIRASSPHPQPHAGNPGIQPPLPHPFPFNFS